MHTAEGMSEKLVDIVGGMVIGHPDLSHQMCPVL